MKKAGAGLLLIALLVGCSGNGGENNTSPKWEKIAETSRSEFFIDVSSITGKKTKDFWVKSISRISDGNEYDISLMSIDCKNIKMATIADYHYKNGAQMRGDEMNNPAYIHIIPETIGQAYYKFICKK